jgi:hypothetical protein
LCTLERESFGNRAPIAGRNMYSGIFRRSPVINYGEPRSNYPQPWRGCGCGNQLLGSNGANSCFDETKQGDDSNSTQQHMSRNIPVVHIHTHCLHSLVRISSGHRISSGCLLHALSSSPCGSSTVAGWLMSRAPPPTSDCFTAVQKTTCK